MTPKDQQTAGTELAYLHGHLFDKLDNAGILNPEQNGDLLKVKVNDRFFSVIEKEPPPMKCYHLLNERKHKPSPKIFPGGYLLQSVHSGVSGNQNSMFMMVLTTMMIIVYSTLAGVWHYHMPTRLALTVYLLHVIRTNVHSPVFGTTTCQQD